MDNLNSRANQGGPYEILRLRCFVLIKRKARIIRQVKSWKLKKDYLNSIVKLAKIIDANDTYTRGHCSKVMKYSLTISRKLDLPSKEIKIIKIASILHDIGKVGIDLSILRKPGKLSESDWEKIKLHPEIGAKIVEEAGLLDEVGPIVRHHHARYEGGGYPDPDICNTKIPIGSRIISVADAFDAMTSNRPYRKAMPKEEALAELDRCSGKQFDPEVVEAFTSFQLGGGI